MGDGYDLTHRDEWAVQCMERQLVVMDDLAARAGDARAWLALERQANSYLRHLDTWLAKDRIFPGARSEMADHKAALEGYVRRAQQEVAGVGPEAIEATRAGLGLRLAVIGKGGAGKTVTSSTLARVLARKGRKVLAADLDVNPGLAISLGLPPGEGGMPPGTVEEHPGSIYGWQLTGDMTPIQVVEKFAATAPDGVRFLGFGKIGPASEGAGADKSAAKQSVAALVHLLLGIGEPDWDVIADLEAGPTTPFERYHAFSEDVIVVVGPAWRSAMTARRLLPMAEGRRLTIVSNRFRDEPDHPDMPARVRIPFDPELAEVERQGLAPVDACPDSPAILAITRLAEMFVNQEVPV
ncbi:MAG TPA: AAA family ATPase [Acidimicrobiales bacterium]|nr:AAA family ATPase [Acidimicrobiales bacterium]